MGGGLWIGEFWRNKRNGGGYYFFYLEGFFWGWVKLMVEDEFDF